jgi:hypothetical protein
VFKRCIRSGGVLIEYLVDFMNAYRRQGEYVLQQDLWKKILFFDIDVKGGEMNKGDGV